MIDVRAIKVKPYKFKDGEELVELKNPSNEFYQSLLGGNFEYSYENVTAVFDGLLYRRDEQYKELDFSIKLQLIMDYVQFHTKQMEERFPSSGKPKE